MKQCIIRATIWDIAFNGWWCKVENLVMSMLSKFKRVQHNSYNCMDPNVIGGFTSVYIYIYIYIYIYCSWIKGYKACINGCMVSPLKRRCRVGLP